MRLVFYNLSDEELFKMIKEKNDNIAFETLLKRYDYLIKGKTIQFYKNNYSILESSDIKQEVILAFYRACLTYDQRKDVAFKTYVSRCIDNALINSLHKEHRHYDDIDLNVDIDKIQHESDNNEPSPEEILIKKDAIEFLIDQINNILSKKEKDFLSYKLQGLSYKEMSNKMNLTSKDLDNLYTSIKRKLKKSYNGGTK